MKKLFNKFLKWANKPATYIAGTESCKCKCKYRSRGPTGGR